MIKKLGQHKGENVKIKARVDTRRDQGKLIFFDFRDISGKIQGVVLPKSEAMEKAKTLRAEWVVEVEGLVNLRPENTVKEGVLNGELELKVENIEVLAEAEIPFDLNEDLNLDVRLDNLPYVLRSERSLNIFKVQSHIVKAFSETLNSLGFFLFQAPKIVGGDAEGGAEVYKLEYFGQEASLATSPQLYKQIMAGALERVYSVGNIFRAEKHSTSRHLNEYTSLDFEMAFIDSQEDVMEVLTKTLRGIKKEIETFCAENLKALGAEEQILLPEEIPKMKLSEAQKLLEETLGFENVVGLDDLDPEHERALSAYAKEKYASDLIYITHYPLSKRPFYTPEDPEDPGHTKSFDALFRGVEIVSGGQRRHRYEEVLEGLRNKNLDPEKFSFYLQAFKTGMPPHGGIGMGLERLTQKILGLSNVKEATLFPREINRIDLLLNK